MACRLSEGWGGRVVEPIGGAENARETRAVAHRGGTAGHAAGLWYGLAGGMLYWET
jgi:hypothetical protein